LNSKNYKPTALTSLLALALSAHTVTAADKAVKPNILFFFVDDMGWQDTSVPFYKETTQLNRDYRTPNMEKLASEGLMFVNAHACTICSPSRVSLMTGQNAARHRVTCWTLRKDRSPERADKLFNPPKWNLNGLQPKGAAIPNSYEADCLPLLLKKAGYHTIHAGKAHFGSKDTPGANPVNLGFDVNIAGSYMGGPGSYYGEHNFSAAWRGGGHIWDIPGLEKYHGQKINLTEAITREVITELEKSVADEKPFYLYLAHYAVHAPFEPDRRFLPNYKDKKWNKHKKIYASMIESMDHSLGDILAAINRLGVADNTIVIFMADNGSPSNNPRNLPLRGYKITPYEGGSRVPLIVKWPGRTPQGSRSESPVMIEDIFPTFLEIAGAGIPKDIDGISFMKLLEKNTSVAKHPPIFWHYPNFYDRPPYSAILLDNYKLIYRHKSRKTVLYNLKDDIGETKDLYSQKPEIAARLAKILSDHLRECKADMPTDKKTGRPIPYPDE